MKKLITVSLCASLFMFPECITLKAQVQNLNTDTAYHTKQQKKPLPPRNFFKVNLTAIALNNYSLQYERALTRKISFALSYRTMPASGIPLKSQLLKMMDADGNTQKAIEDARLGNTAITPELRFYLSRKGYGRGFYLAPFCRLATFKANNIDIFYTDSSDAQNSIKLSGKLTSRTGGLLIGTQYSLGRHIILDMQLLGPHFGSVVGNFTGTSAKPLSQDEQDQVQSSLSNLNIPLINKTATVNASTASMHVNGSWGGVRAGISLGFRF